MSPLPLIAALLRADPGLGGVVLRGRAGPAQTAALDVCASALGPLTALHPAMGPEALDGEVDAAASLASGRVIRTAGLLARGPVLRLPSAERTTPWLAARLARHLDGCRSVLIAVDEGIDAEALPQALAARCAFHLTLPDRAEPLGPVPPEGDPPATVTVPEALLSEIVTLAATLGVDDPRGAMLALRAARGLAALAGRTAVTLEDASRAAELVLAPRATRLPEPPPEASDPEAPSETETRLPEDILLDAVRAALPTDILAQLARRAARGATGQGSGAKRRGNRRGRPLPARAGGAGNGRIDLVATLRAAAPWQTIRRRAAPERRGPIFRQDDLRHRRFEETSDRLLIFTVDASGSAALARLAEAKGAVELLLSQAYSRRDHVALVAFRGTGAEALLPPTRSLVQTKRRLAALPGGGATPLAHGLREARTMAVTARRKGMTPTIVLLTDGRGNVALDGTRDRAQAAEDAQRVARGLRGTDAIILDTGARPSPTLRRLAETLDAPYLPLPRADAQRLSQAVDAACAS
ncbi:VWA domain-containing protein [Jannaschia marina]|uniref:VWA domain-containing protein n=1 Tax=Jannaschia marina TaxID=2741674 RepID=UPI0015C9E3DA|nr:VWA domain-containing protein [Jannaschia marina]